MRARTTMLSVAAATFTLLGTTITPAHAADPEVLADGLVTPLSVAVGDDGTAYFSQNFAGLLTRVAPGGGEPEVLFAHPEGAEVGAVSVDATGVTFATTGGTRRAPTADLWHLATDAESPTRLSNLHRFEKQQNPDAGTKYGFKGLDRSCKQKLPKFVLPYNGIVESHPYATALGDGVTYVADAAGNSILAVDESGTSAVATLPPTKITVTRKLRKQYELPRCVTGKTYRAEGVPTDVELGPDGNLYVTSLPGAPGEGLPVGRIYRIAPATGDVSKMADDLVAPTGLAISPTGTAYIAMLFASTILEVPLGGEPTVFAEVPFPGDVEFVDGHVYATETGLMNEDEPTGRILSWDTTPAR